MPPGTVNGSITLLGPTSAATSSYLTGNNIPNEGMRLATSSNQGLYDDGFYYKYSRVRAVGGITSASSQNANHAGQAITTIVGSVSGSTFNGSHDYRVAGLGNLATTPSPWYIGLLELWIHRPSMPSDILDFININNHLAAQLADATLSPDAALSVMPNQTYTSDMKYCLSEVTVTFYNPVDVYVDGQLGRTYTVEASSDLTTWTPVAGLRNTDGVLRFTDPSSSSARQRFYRVIEEF